MNRYTIGGVAFVVAESLPGLDTGGFADITIAASFTDGAPGRDRPAVLRVSGPGDLVGLIDTAAMTCWLPDRYSEPTDRAWQLRQMAPVFSSVCERLVLHASGVQTDAGAVGFIGESGVGKSTLARSLSGIGCRIAGDDLMPVRFTPLPHTPVDGRLHPIDGLFFLRRARISWPAITSLGAIDALQLQISNGFGEHGDDDTWAFQFDAYHRLVAAVPHFNLVVPDDLEALEDSLSNLVVSMSSALR